MTWNHRVMRHVAPSGEEFFAIHEVFYDDDGTPKGYTADAISVSGEDMDSLRWVLLRMIAATDKPILTPEDCGG